MNTRKRIALIALVTFLIAGAPGRADAGLIVAHQGSTDPTTEGFPLFSSFGSGTTGPVNDSGVAAYNVTSTSSTNQIEYSYTPTTAQDSLLASQGFTFSVDARVVSGPMNGSGGNFYPSSDDDVCFGTGVRYDIDFGLNSNGNTVVVLPTALNGGENFYTPGQSVTVTGSGYHLYSLVYNPVSGASLYIDGVLSLSGYQGETQFTGNYASFGADNGGSMNYASVSLVSGSVVPEPSSLALVTIGGLIALVLARRRSGSDEGLARSPEGR